MDLAFYEDPRYMIYRGMCGQRDNIFPPSHIVTLAFDFTFSWAFRPHTHVAVHCGHFSHTHCCAVSFHKEKQGLIRILFPSLRACGLPITQSNTSSATYLHQLRLHQHDVRHVRDRFLHVSRKQFHHRIFPYTRGDSTSHHAYQTGERSTYENIPLSGTMV